MNKSNLSFTTAEMDLWGRSLTAQLNVASLDLGHDIGERLRMARQTALKARTVPLSLMRYSLAVQTHGAHGSEPDEGLNIWRILASALPLLALVSALLFIQTFQKEMMVSDIAILDSALLLDELPPDAYADPGFMQFLKLQVHQNARND